MPVTEQTATVVKERSGGMCECCWIAPGQQLHHRRAKGMGGDPRWDVDLPGNLMNVCSACHHGRIHARPAWAVDNGYRVRMHVDDVTTVPVKWQPTLLNDDWYAVTLDHNGGVHRAMLVGFGDPITIAAEWIDPDR